MGFYLACGDGEVFYPTYGAASECFGVDFLVAGIIVRIVLLVACLS